MNFYLNITESELQLNILSQDSKMIYYNEIELGQFIKKFDNYFLFIRENYEITFNIGEQSYRPQSSSKIISFYPPTFSFKEYRKFLIRSENLPYNFEINAIKNFYKSNNYNFITIDHIYHLNINNLTKTNFISEDGKHVDVFNMKATYINRVYFK